MSVPEHKVIRYHIECRFENGFFFLPLPEFDVETTLVLADASV
jgi:hypothetical protein